MLSNKILKIFPYIIILVLSALLFSENDNSYIKEYEDRINSLNQKRFEDRKACNDDNWKQFVLDAWRSNIYINNNYVSDPVTVKNKYNHLDSMMKNRIWIFSSQTAFVIPVELLSNEIMDKGYYLAEISNQDSENPHHSYLSLF